MDLQDRTYHLVHSLTSTKSCLIVANMVHEGIEGGQEALVELFEVLLTGIRTDHSQVRVSAEGAFTPCVVVGDVALPSSFILDWSLAEGDEIV